MNKELKPGLLAALISIGFLAVLFVIGVSIAGSYVLMLNYIHHLEATQVAQAVHSCKSLITLDHSGHGVVFPKADMSHPSELVLSRMLHGIHDVVETSKCYALLSGHYKPAG